MGLLSQMPPPPWIVKPEWPPDSLGWRMGGEIFFYEVREKFAALSAEDKLSYLQTYPCPEEWEGYLTPGSAASGSR